MTPHSLTRRILDHWFADLDDHSPLDQANEPFAACHARWYGHDPAVDQQIREQFAPALREVTADGARWFAQVQQWAEIPGGLLALVVLLDQFPRNMHRGEAGMHRYDALAQGVATLALDRGADQALPLVRRKFLYMPLMHAESLTLQQASVQHFRELLALAKTRSPHNVPFFELVLDYAHKHMEVIEQFGRFPHRNPLLGRISTPEEQTYLQRPDAGF